MRHTTLLAVTVAFGLVLLAGCGGGGNGFNAPSNPLIIMSSTLPAVQSGDTVDYEIPLDGGCGGPYVVEVISGNLPDGVGADQTNGRHHLTGVLLVDGTFEFTIKVTDTSCTPFLTAVQSYTWDVTTGPVQIVGANPGIIPVGDYDDPLKWADIDALEKTVYGQFISYKLIVAGGVAPYSIATIDDPSDPNDNVGLPTGVSIPNASTSFVGTPIQVGDGGKPFRITFRATDAVGGTAVLKLQWKVDTPPIIIANPSLGNGQAGSNFADTFQIVDGVPPFRYELLDDAPTVANEDIVYNAPNAPTFPSASGFTVDPATGKASNMLFDGSPVTYPGPADAGPFTSGMPSEGLALNIDTGGFAGTPRRAGTFTIYLHVCSTLVPNERGQHAFATYTHTIAPSEPPQGGNPAFGLVPTFTVENVFLGPPIYSTLPEFEVGQNYNPDGNASGLQLLAEGGVPADGKTDAPHAHQVMLDLAEVPGTYKWSYDWDVNAGGVQGPPAGISSTPDGVIDVVSPNSLVRVGREYLDITVHDYQLPIAIENDAAQRLGYSVGPDVAIITHSNTSTTTYDFYWSTSDRFKLNDTEMTIQKLEIFGGTTPVRSVLNDTDLVQNHTVPASAGLSGSNHLGALISGVTVDGGSPTGGGPNLDLLRCVVNATGWWDDMFHMNPKGAQPYRHSDANVTDRPYGEFGSSYSNMGNFQPPCSAVDLPDVGDPGVSGILNPDHNPSQGIYMNGGLCYHFESSTHYGIFVIRPDAKVYVPFAMQKPSANSTGFGDGVLFDKGTNMHSALRTVQMTVSPDGRFAAMKLKSDQNYLFEHADDSQILFVSLTGEKIFGESAPGANDGDTYRIVNIPATSLTGSSSARIAYASSFALTNEYLYFLIGTQSPTTNSTSSSTYLYYQSWRGHFLMRCAIETGSVTKLPNPGGDPNWTQDDSQTTTMQTVFHHHGPNASSSSSYWGLIETYTSYGRWPYHRYWQEEGMNFFEHNVAPAPFRVSANGKAVAFFAAPDYFSTGGNDVYSTYCWIDYDGTGAKRITNSRRHHSVGSGRAYTIVHGPNEYVNWGRYHGPTPGIEISDDGLAVAFNYGTSSYMSSSASYSSSSNYWMQYREDLLLTRSTAGTWGSYAESEITKNTFGGSHRWRFGSIAFTQDGTGVVFWGGAPTYQSNYSSYSYNRSFHFHGAYYIHTVGDTNKVTSMLATSEGGNPNGEGQAYTSSSPFNPSSTSGINNRFGAIHPMGGFMSRNRKFMYVATTGAISSSEQTAGKVIGLNVQSANAGSFNGHTNGRGFVPANWPSRRGFFPMYYYYYGNYYPHYQGYAPKGFQGVAHQIMAKDTGWVYFVANYQYSGPSNSGSTSYGQWAYPTYYGYGYAYGGLGLYAWNADMGGAIASLHQSGWAPNSTGTYAFPSMLEVSRDGSRLVAVYASYYITYPYRNRERVRVVSNIDFDTANGAMSGSFSPTNDSKDFETSDGRAGSGLAIVNGGTDVYYAYKAGSGNENDKNLVLQRFDQTAGSWTKFTASSVNAANYNVLWAGR